MPSLRELQARFLAALPPGAPPPDPGLRAVVRGRGALDATARLGIYAAMYRTRLLDVLREDFPRTAAVLGPARFAAVAGDYLARHASRHPSVRSFGDAFAAHLAAAGGVPPFAADLARLEWARVEVFDAPDPAPLRLADLAPVAPKDWPALRLSLIAACRLLETAWPVHALWAAADGARPVGQDAPAAARGDAPPAGTVEPAPTLLRVWREGWSVSHAAVGAAEARALRVLQRGGPFAELCAAVAGDADPGAAAREAGSLLLRWLEDGLLARPEAAP